MLDRSVRHAYLALFLITTLSSSHTTPLNLQSTYIAQASSVEDAREIAESIGAEITHELGIINAVGIKVTRQQFEELKLVEGLRVYSNAVLRTSGGPKPDAEHVKLVGADELHQLGIYGTGVTVAVVDTGIWYSHNHIKRDLNKRNKIVAEYSAINRKEKHTKDKHGHGTHLVSIIASSQFSDNGKLHGIAPNVDLVSVKAFNKRGNGNYADVIRGFDWILANMSEYNIRVVNLSFSTAPRSYYWDDPVNQAVMKLWQAGIVVVVSAGNGGPGPMTIGVPGNVPYVITVGAMTDNYTPEDPGDDRLTKFSAAGPTVEAFVKPDVVAPGGHVLGIMDDGNHRIADQHPEWVLENDRLYRMSGTSQSAAIVTGVVALMLQSQPWLTPDQVKCKLMSTARSAVDSDGLPAYSVFQQGAGLVNAVDAVNGVHYDCANRGLDIQADIAGTAHFGGRATQDEDGNYYIMGADGYAWDGIYRSADGYLDGAGMLWNDSTIWNVGMLWNDNTIWNVGMLWNDSTSSNENTLGNEGMLWNDLSDVPTSVNVWVDQE